MRLQRKWDNKLAQLSSSEKINWVIGVSKPYQPAMVEAEKQKKCLLFALYKAFPNKKFLAGNLSFSGYRSFNKQRSIWNRKYLFKGRAFNQISAHARQICGAVLFEKEKLWHPSNRRHQYCWKHHPNPVVKGFRSLSSDEKQLEILQASSAPGTSRHHWGTDFDIIDPHMNPEYWRKGEKYYTIYLWLQKNAWRYGFVQPYKDKPYKGHHYIEERWHWSYLPVSHSLLKFIDAHQRDIEEKLIQSWGHPTRYSFIKRKWPDYVLNVDEN